MNWSTKKVVIIIKTVAKDFFTVFIMFLFLFLYFETALANPYGYDTYGLNIPYGSETMLSIATNGNASLAAQSGSLTTNSTSPTVVTVTTTDANGYTLYIRSALNKHLASGGNTISASSNLTPATLANNTWGYTTNGGDLTQFTGISGSDVGIKYAVSGPYYPTGNTTNVYYGVKIDDATPAGVYTGSIVFTAVAQSP